MFSETHESSPCHLEHRFDIEIIDCSNTFFRDFLKIIFVIVKRSIFLLGESLLPPLMIHDSCGGPKA